MSGRVVGLFWCALTVCAALGADEPMGPSPETVSAIETIRVELRELRFEEALAAIETLLATPDLPAATAVEALALRAQARVATGALERAVEDWDRILTLRPSFVPDPDAFPRKALARFEALRSGKVGNVRFTLAPADARLLVDGAEVKPGDDGLVWLVAGDHVATAERGGFDPAETAIAVSAGPTTPASLRLVPNARTVVIATEPEGVEVRWEGRLLGTTARAGTSGGADDGAPARLVLENLALGEYVFELTKPCYRSTRIRVPVTADLRDPWPMRLETVRLVEARARLIVKGGPEAAEIRVDDEPRGALPADPLDVCAGRRRVEVHARGRTVWRGDIEAPELGNVEVEVVPRPNACLFGEGDWPRAVRDLVATLGPCGGAPDHPGRDLAAPADWEGIALARDTDLAFALVPATTAGLAPRVVLFSPLLGSLEDLPPSWVPAERPSWERPWTGMRLADSPIFGPAVVVELASAGPAAAAGLVVGDRIASVGGEAIDGAGAVDRAITTSAPGAEVEMEVMSADGQARKVVVVTGSWPRLVERSASPGGNALTAAWASVDAAAAKDPTLPLANLAAALSSAGRYEAAVEVGRRARAARGAGPGRGAAAYALARDLLALGHEDEARELFRVARDEGGTFWNDGGPDLAPAASDHLADLGAGGR